MRSQAGVSLVSVRATALTRMCQRENSRASAFVISRMAAAVAPMIASPGVGWRAASVVTMITEPARGQRVQRGVWTGRCADRAVH
jgi:hypothetical protein